MNRGFRVDSVPSLWRVGEFRVRFGMAEPDIYKYLDFRAYLRDWFETRRARDPKFSRRQFARLAGKRSPGLLTSAMEGDRQLTPPMVRAFAQAMDLNADESAFFDALVQLDQARDSRARNDAWERVSATRAFREARPIEGASMAFLSHWWFPVVRELALRADFVPEAAWVAQRIRPSITEAQARRALEALETMGFFKRDVDGVLIPADDGVVTTPHEVQGLAVRNYHRGMLARASEAIDGFRSQERHFVAATMLIPERLVPMLKDEINAFQERVLDMANLASEDGERVVHVHVAMFPLTEGTAEED